MPNPILKFDSNRLADSMVARVILRDGVQWLLTECPLPIVAEAGDAEYIRAGLCSKGLKITGPDGVVTEKREKRAGYILEGTGAGLRLSLSVKPDPDAKTARMSATEARDILTIYGTCPESPLWQTGDYAQSLRRARMILGAVAAEGAATALLKTANATGGSATPAPAGRVGNGAMDTQPAKK